MTAPVPPAPSAEQRRRQRRPWLWLVAAVSVSLVLLTVAWVLDQRRAPPAAPPRATGPIADLVPPSKLTDRERSGNTAAMGSQDSVRLEQGGWVQVAGPDGNVKQQYAAAEMNPLPDRRIAMRQPRAVLFGNSGRVVTMRSDTMTARVAKRENSRELESGRMEGTVVIRVYRPRDGKPVDLAKDAAELVIEAPEAEFDAGAAEIRVDRSVRVVSEALTFEGEGLTMRLSQDGKRIERLQVERPLSPIRIDRNAEVLRERSRGLGPGRAGAVDPGLQAGALCVAGGGGAGGGGGRGGDAAQRQDAQRMPYLLKLHDNVHVVNWENGNRSVMDGAELRVLFAMTGEFDQGITEGAPAPGRKGKRSGGQAAAADAAAPAGGAQAGGAPAAPAPAPHAARSERNDFPPLPPSPLPVSGGSTVPDPAPPAGSGQGGQAAVEKDSLVITYTGRLEMAPAEEDAKDTLVNEQSILVEMLGAPARVEDDKSHAVLTGRRIQYQTGNGAMRMEGQQEAPASVETPEFGLRSLALELNATTGKGKVDGLGRIRLGRADGRPLDLGWSGSAAFTLEPGTPQKPGALRSAQFAKDVRVRSQDFALDAQGLSVEVEQFRTAGGKERPVLRRLVADGGVLAARLGDRQGRMQADWVEMLLQPDSAGDAQPRTMHAKGNVVVADDAQTMWAKALRVGFAPAARKADAAKAQLSSVMAEGPVRLALKDGTNIWAERLEGDGLARTALLYGPNVLVVRGNVVLDQLAQIQVQESPGKISALGPGRVSQFRDRVLPEGGGSMQRPVIVALPQMQATWRDGLAFAEGAIPGKLGAPDRGLLLLQGAVRVRAARTPLEAEALDADEVQIETLPQGKAAAKQDATTAGDERSVARLVSRGNVRVEARQWTDEAHTGEPRLFLLNSANATYDVLTGMAQVDGVGSMLLNDPAAPSAAPKKAAQAAPFSPEGVTKFTWTRSLAFRRTADGVATLALDGDVEMRHLGETDAGTATLAADHMEATVRGVEQAPASAEGGTLALGAGGKLEQVVARGRVTVRTGEYDIETGEFTLDEASQVATLKATPGRTVTILKRGTASPVRAQSATWDMKSGIITIEELRTTLPR
ncbi:MAG: hypothetical protein U0636_05465 [Phycisphaerales bacterium]